MSLPNEDPVLDMKAVARMLGLTHARALDLARLGQLPFVWRTSPNGGYRAMTSDVLSYRESMRVKGGGR